MFWYLEFQQRGAPHFHGLISKGVDGKELRKIWYKIVGSNDPKHLRRGAHIAPIRTSEGMLHYLTGYLTKQEQKTVPEEYRSLGRFWGYSRSLLDPYIIKIIFGTQSELRAFRAKHIRPIRRWVENQRKFWKNKKKIRKFTNQYSEYIPGQYLTVINGRRWINELKRHGLDTSLFE
jgi:hypothetical protein